MQDPLDAWMVWAAGYGWLGLAGIALFERMVPILPAHALMMVLGVACAQGLWPWPQAWLLSALVSAVGCGLIYLLGRGMGREGHSRRSVLRLAARLGASPVHAGRWLRRLRSGGGRFAVLAQMLPLVRELAPALAGWLRVSPGPFMLRTALGILVWNGVFMGAGWWAARAQWSLGTSTLAALLLAALLLAELTLVVVWHMRRKVRTAKPVHDSWAAFLLRWWRDPLQVGAIAPSGEALARQMTRHVHAHGPVIELGPGTGVFTRALLRRGVAPQQLVLVEADPVFADSLRRTNDGLRVVCMDAAWLAYSGALFGRIRARAVVSGLPLVAMPLAQRQAIVEAAFDRHLGPQGRFYQFSYFPRCALPAEWLAARGLHVQWLGFALLNLPPAFVYCIHRGSGPLRELPVGLPQPAG